MACIDLQDQGMEVQVRSAQQKELKRRNTDEGIDAQSVEGSSRTRPTLSEVSWQITEWKPHAQRSGITWALCLADCCKYKEINDPGHVVCTKCLVSKRKGSFPIVRALRIW